MFSIMFDNQRVVITEDIFNIFNKVERLDITFEEVSSLSGKEHIDFVRTYEVELKSAIEYFRYLTKDILAAPMDNHIEACERLKLI